MNGTSFVVLPKHYLLKEDKLLATCFVCGLNIYQFHGRYQKGEEVWHEWCHKDKLNSVTHKVQQV